MICKICNNILDINSPNYIKNNKCGCIFHYKCFEKRNNNFFSISFPTCISCKSHYNKNDLLPYENVSYELAFDYWIGDNLIYKICSQKNCPRFSKNKYLNFCKKHFYENYSEEKLNEKLIIIFKQYIGIPADKKIIALKELLSLN